jgi:benzoyl-CoA reductase/2-hydroxyglutaryl-CoA dehydratase subunit BcrC/BadD/HgdB
MTLGPKHEPPERNLAILQDKRNPLGQSISRMKYVLKFSRLEGHKDLLRLTYFEGPSSFYEYFRSPRRAFANLGIPKEIFYMLGIDVLFIEQVSVLIASSAMNREVIGESRKFVPSSTYCSFHQASLGAIEAGYFPLPDVFVAPSFICEETIALCTWLGKKYDIPVFYVDCPHSTDEGAQIYLAEELRRLADNLAKHFGIQPDPARIRQTLAWSNEARHWWLRYQDQKARIVTTKYLPIQLQTLMHGALLGSKFGLAQTVELTKKCYEELCQIMETNREAEAAPAPQPRILWLHMLPYHTSSLVKLLDALEVHIVADETSQITWDELDLDDPWRSLAKKYMQYAVYGAIDWRLQKVQDLVEKFAIDGIIELNHPGCKPACGQTNFIKDYFRPRGVPHLTIVADLIDPENYSIEQLRTRIEAFLEILKKK